MIIKGSSRGNWGWFAGHLAKTEENERVDISEIRGLRSGDIRGALREMSVLADGWKGKNFFYHASMNPDEGEQLTPEQWQSAVDRLEHNLGLDDHARIVVQHEKLGRIHTHVVWQRIDPETMTAASDSLTYAKHEQTSRELEAEFGLRPVDSVLVKDRGTPRPGRRPKDWEGFRAAQSKIPVETVRGDLTRIWQATDNGQSFKAAIEEAGYILARGDRRDFVIIDQAGDDHSIARRIEGAKAKDIRERLSDIDSASLPSVAEAREQARASTGSSGGEAVPEAAPEPGNRPLYWSASRGAYVTERPWNWGVAGQTHAKPAHGGYTEAPQGIAAESEPAPQGAAHGWRQTGQAAWEANFTAKIDALTTQAAIQQEEARQFGDAPKATTPDAEAELAARFGDHRHAPQGVAAALKEAPQGAGGGWQQAEPGRGSDRREQFTFWEGMAHRVRAYAARMREAWEEFTASIDDDTKEKLAKLAGVAVRGLMRKLDGDPQALAHTLEEATDILHDHEPRWTERVSPLHPEHDAGHPEPPGEPPRDAPQVEGANWTEAPQEKPPAADTQADAEARPFTGEEVTPHGTANTGAGLGAEEFARLVAQPGKPVGSDFADIVAGKVQPAAPTGKTPPAPTDDSLGATPAPAPDI